MSQPSYMRIRVDDIVGIAVNTYRNGEVTGSKIMVRGQVVKVYKESPRGKYRAKVYWEDKARAFIYTGNKDWVYLSQLTLVRRSK